MGAACGADLKYLERLQARKALMAITLEHLFLPVAEAPPLQPLLSQEFT